MAPAKKNWKIFLVDDHVLMREWLMNLITQQQDLAVCGEAASVPEALEKIALSKPDVVLVDISLKGASGIELIKEVKLRFPEMLVLVLSMYEGIHYVERALKAGANGYVMKRESARKVIEAIRKVLEGGFYVSEDTGQMLAERLIAGRSSETRSWVEQFSDREQEVFQLLGQGKNAGQIADTLHIDVKTVHTYCARMREKLHVNTTSELLREAFRWHEARHP